MPNFVTYDPLIAGCCESGGMHKAEGLLNEMITRRFSPVHITHETIIHSYIKNGNSQEVF
jgi:pentatricopeptide repeat protein